MVHVIILGAQWFASAGHQPNEQRIRVRRTKAIPILQAEVYLTSKWPYRCAKTDGKVLAVFVFNKDWTWQKAIQIDTTEDKTVELEFWDVPRDGEYLMTAFLYNDSAPRDGKATLNWVRLVNQSWCTQSFVYPSAVDNSLVVVDGAERRDVGSDLSVTYAPNDTAEWRRHVVTFKTKDALPTDTEQYALLRLLPSPITGQKNYCEICMPKLEAGKVASTYTRNITDVAADIPTPALVFRGEYDASKTYYGNRYRVDACKFGNAYYVCRNDAGEVKGIEPTNTSKWNSFGASFDSVATGLLLAENAEIAGWTFRNNRLESKNGAVWLDGVNGKIMAQGGFTGMLKAENLFIPFVSLAQIRKGISGEYVLKISDPTNITMGTLYDTLVLPSETSFNGMFLNVYLHPHTTRMSGGCVKGNILCPNKSVPNGVLVTEYYASEITCKYGGILQMVNIQGIWILLNGTELLEYS